MTVGALRLLAAWITDGLDGALARLDPRGGCTWIDDRDLKADMTLALGA